MSRRRSRAQNARKPVSPPSPTAANRQVFGSKWLVILIAGGLIVFAWWGKSFWSKPAQPTATGSAASTPLKASVSAVPLASAEHQDKQSDEFKTKVNRGSALLAENKLDEAYQVFSEALKMNPSDEDVHYNLGVTLTRLGKIDEAVEQYRIALRLYPKYVEAHNNLGNLLMRNGQNTDAIQHFEAAIELMPDYASAHNNLGTALQRAGQTNEALLQFQKAASIEPDYWQAHFNVALSLFASGRLDDARSELQTVLRLKPDFAPAKAALTEVEARTAK